MLAHISSLHFQRPSRSTRPAHLPTNLLIEADTLHTLKTGRARSTDCRNPFHTNTVSDFYGTSFSSWTELDDASDAFVATNLIGLCRVGKDGPRLHHDAVVGVADAGVCPERGTVLDELVCEYWYMECRWQWRTSMA